MGLTLANWIPVCRLLVDNVNMAAGYGVLVFKVVVGFAVVRVVVGVFLLETFKTASTDDELMAAQARRSQGLHASKMSRFLREADKDGDGYIQEGEFKHYLLMEGPWLAAQGLDVQDDELLFNLLDDGDGKLSPAEVARGISRLKGPARSVDMISLMHMVSLLQEKLTVIATRFEAITTYEQTLVESARHESKQNDLCSPLLAYDYTC